MQTNATNSTPVQRIALSVEESAAAVGLSPRFVWTLIERGELRTVRAGRRVLIPVEELTRFARISEPEVACVQ